MGPCVRGFAVQLVHLTLDVAKMYRKKCCSGPRQFAREYGGSSTGTGVFCGRVGAGEGASAE
jgi:hypothetical protein